MFRFVAGVIIYTLISMLCFSVFGQGWQDEEHVWNEETQQWDVHNKAVVAVPNNDKPEKKEGQRFAPPTEEWSRYLPSTVRRGKREATQREISEARRKLWVKQVMAQRSAAKSEQRRQLIAHRKATGWYGSRRSGSHSRGLSWPMQMHMRSVGNHLGGGYNGYY